MPRQSKAKMGKHPKAWAFRFADGRMDYETFDSPDIFRVAEKEAGRAARVRIVPEADYRKLMTAWRKCGDNRA